jgi:hypothetical protein
MVGISIYGTTDWYWQGYVVARNAAEAKKLLTKYKNSVLMKEYKKEIKKYGSADRPGAVIINADPDYVFSTDKKKGVYDL